MLIDERYLPFIILLISYVLASFFSMSLGRCQSPRKAMRDWLAHSEEKDCREKAARAVRDYRLETPRRDNACDLSRSHESRIQAAGRPRRRLRKDANLESGEEAFKITHDIRSS